MSTRRPIDHAYHPARLWRAAAIALAAAVGACDAAGEDAASTAQLCTSDDDSVARRASGSECDWPQAGRSPRRTGYNDGESILSPETVGGLVEAWAAPIGDAPAADDVARPVVWRGSAFATSGPELVSLDAETGAQTWRFAGTGDSFLHAPAVGSGRVHAFSADALFGVDADTGAELWRAPHPAPDLDATAPLVSGEAVYVVTHRFTQPFLAGAYSAAAATGELLWNTSSGSSNARGPAVADGRVYHANPGSDLTARRITDGVDEWNYAFADGIVGNPAVSRGLVVAPLVQCCADLFQAINAVDAESGELVWTTELACTPPLDSSPVVDGTRAYVACNAVDGIGVEVLGLSLATGAVELDVTVGTGALTGELSGANGVLYVGSTDGFLRAPDASTGDELLAIELASPMSQPAIANGRVLVGAGSTVHAFALPD